MTNNLPTHSCLRLPERNTARRKPTISPARQFRAMINPLATLRQHVHRLPFLLLLATLAAILLKHIDQATSCQTLLDTGRWSIDHPGLNSRRQWHTYEVLLHAYDGPAIKQCLQNQTLHFAGDSTIRQIFWAVAEKLNGDGMSVTSQHTGKHQDLTYTEADATLSFCWDPYLKRAETLAKISTSGQDSVSAGILLSTGLWQTRFSGGDFLEEVRSTIKNITDTFLLRNNSRTAHSYCYSGKCSPTILIPPPYLDYGLLDPNRAKTLTESASKNLSHTIKETTRYTSLEVAWSTQQLTFDTSSALDNTGLHVTNATAALQADVLLNRICNNRVLHGNEAIAHACVDASKVHHRNWLISICLCFAACVVFLNLACHGWKTRSSSLQATMILLAIVSYCRLTDRTLLFGKSDKVVSLSMFVISVCALLSICLCSARLVCKSVSTELPSSNMQGTSESSRQDFLSRSQTEEWKGWMQIVILLYHYFGMSKVLWIYQLVRVLVACYLFLTGYGHATHLQKSRECTIRRLATVLVRLNILPIALAYLMNNSYDFYYFPGLASLWVLITYATFWNYAKTELSHFQCLMRIATSFGVVKLLLSGEHIIVLLTQMLQAGYGPRINPKEFIFRVSLDVYAPYFGMLVSVLVNQSDVMSKYVVQLRSGQTGYVQQSLHVVVALVLLGSYLAKAGCFPDKYSYNRWHSMLSLLPISAYILLRNANGRLRSYEVPIFRWIGTISLELFVLQYHLWLAADTKGILRLGLLDTPLLAAGKTVVGSWTFWGETTVVTIVFVWLSDCCSQATSTIVRTFVNVEDSSKGDRQPRVVFARVSVLVGVLWLVNFADRAG